MTYQYLSGPDGNCNHVALLSDSFEYLLVIPLNTPGQELDAFNTWLDEGNKPLPAPGTEITWDTIRAKRDQLIRDSDWTVLPGATVDQAQWSAYRQILRDLPQTFANSGPGSVIWPKAPSTKGPNTPKEVENT